VLEDILLDGARQTPVVREGRLAPLMAALELNVDGSGAIRR
jgi:hypothetical protein